MTCRSTLSSPACKEYETGFKVCLTFLEFYLANGAVSQFGFPISNFRIEDGRIVQYFNRAKFTWLPKGMPGQRVQLSDLGRIYFYQHLENPELLEPEAGNIVEDILGLKTRVFTEKALVGSGESLTVYVIVQDQNLNPVPNANVSIVLKSSEGEADTNHLLPPTGENGFAKLTIPYYTEEVGVVEIEAAASYGEFKDRAVTSFRVWW